MIRLSIVLLLTLITTSSVKAQCKYYNKLDEKGNRTGLWLSYWDSSKKILHRKFHYKKGREFRMNKIYFSDGNLMTKERHVKNRIKVKSYDEQGKLQRKGWAKIDFNADDLHFYWHGHWKFYNVKHQLIGISIYENGFFINPIENKRTKRNQIKE